MIYDERSRPCPKCGERMLPVVGGVWSLRDRATQDFMCPNCLHAETIRYRIRADGTLEEMEKS